MSMFSIFTIFVPLQQAGLSPAEMPEESPGNTEHHAS